MIEVLFLRQLQKIAINRDFLFGYAPERLRDNKELAMLVVNHDCDGFPHLSERLCNDREFVFNAVLKNSAILEYASERIRKDKEIAHTLADRGVDVIYCMNKSITKDKDIMLKCVRIDGYMLQYLPKPLKNDHDIVLAAVSMVLH